MRYFQALLYLTLLFTPVWFPLPAQAEILRTSVPSVLLIDEATGTILFSQKADSVFFPATLSKLMTAEVIFDALKRGEITPETLYSVSRYAWMKGGAPSGTSTMFARINSTVTVKDLLQGLIVANGNDSAIILAEGLSGSEEAFTRRMNERAAELGMEHSYFVNATGLPPAAGQKTSLQDMMFLARHIYRSYPEYFALYAQPSFEWSRIFQRNRNPLLGQGINIDGFAAAGAGKNGYSAIATAQMNNRRLFLAMTGISSDKHRTAETARILKWGFDNFERKLVYNAGALVGKAAVYGGTKDSVALKTVDPIAVLLAKANPPQLTGKIRYQGPIDAPVAEGMHGGTITLFAGETVVVEAPLVTAEAVKNGGLSGKAWDAFVELTLGWIRKYR